MRDRVVETLVVCLIDRVIGLKLPQPAQRILPIEKLQLLVDLWISLVQQIRGAEKVFAGDGEELCRVSAAYGSMAVSASGLRSSC